MQRAARIVGQLEPRSVAKSPAKSPDDIVVVAAVRTAVGRAKKGHFKDTHPTELLVAVLKGVMAKAPGVKHTDIADIVVGNVLAPGGFATQARMAQFLAGFPESVPIATVNRQCSSGLQAFVNVAANIRAGNYDMAIAAGVESMSLSDMMASVGEINEKVFENPLAAQCLNTMGQTSENVVERFKISREKQDEIAVLSNERAIAAQKAGHFDAEIVAVRVKNGDQEIEVKADDGPRAGTSLATLAKLPGAFKKGGSTTAGNSSQTSDGAAAVIVTSRRKAAELKLPILGRFRSFAVVGVEPSIMGVGPAFAIPPALKKAGVTMDEVDVFEINEAFASQVAYCVEKLGVPLSKLNPTGGAIALGHPLGCTGARQIATLLHGLKRTGKKVGVVSMCIGTGMGAAAVFEAE